MNMRVKLMATLVICVGLTACAPVAIAGKTVKTGVKATSKAVGTVF